ncbi:hypothetical protein M9458_009931, partial [Cirrhinus mrigala]
DLLHEHCGLFFVPLSLAMLNDDSATCKKMAALAINLEVQNSMFTLVNTWLTDEKAALRRLGAQVCGLFVEVEGAKFNQRLKVLIPLIEKEIHASNFEDVSDLSSRIEEEEEEKAADRLLFCYLTLIVKLIKDCGFLELHTPADLLNSIWSQIDSHLRYPHCWVWLTASQIFGLLFAAHKPEELLALWRSKENKSKSKQPVATAFLIDNLYQKAREQRTCT